MGTTAVGKTDLVLRLADKYPIEIISVDSALIYQDMDIGTAKPTLCELNSAPHHLINIITPLDSYSVIQFIESTNLLIREINNRGKIPVLVGGTMMYYNALLNGISVLPEANLIIRTQLEKRILDYGIDSLYIELLGIDTEAAHKINSNDRHRIIRALEVYYLSGKPISQLQKETNICVMKNVDFLSLGVLPNNREVLHSRINKRFEQMIASGFIDEVLQLKNKYPQLSSEHTSMRCVGYYQVWQYLDNLINKTDLLEMGKAATRQLAKRQTTWLRSIDFINIATDDNLNPECLFASLQNHLKSFI